LWIAKKFSLPSLARVEKDGNGLGSDR